MAKELKDYQAKELVLLYRQVFGTGEGQLVLQDLLTMMGYFDDSAGAKTAEQIALSQCAKMILQRCGAHLYANRARVIRTFLRLPIELKEKGEN